MPKKDNKENFANCLIYVVFAVVIAFCMYCTPLTHDDLEFAKTELSIQRVVDIGNGRYLGNWLSLFLCQSMVGRVIMKTVCITSIAMVLHYLLELDGVISPLLCVLLMLFPGRNIFSETYTWTAGFSIYVPGVFIMLLAYAIAKFGKTLTNKYVRGTLCMIILLLSAAAQLFVEHATLLNLCGTFLLLLFAIKNKVNIQERACLFIGTMVGAVGIFLLPNVGEISQEMKGYRGVLVSLSTIRNNVTQLLMLTRFMSACTVLLVALSLVLIYKLKTENKLYSYKYVNLILVIMPVYSLLMGNMTEGDSWAIEHATLLHFTYVALFIWFVVVTAFWLLKFKFDNKYQILFSYGAGIFILLILCVVSPVGGRTLFLVYICWTITVLLMFKEVVFDVYFRKIVNVVLGVWGAVMCYAMLFSFQSIHIISLAREQYIEESVENGETEIFIPTANVDGYIYNDSVDIKDGIQVYFVDWKCWKNMQKQ